MNRCPVAHRPAVGGTPSRRPPVALFPALPSPPRRRRRTPRAGPEAAAGDADLPVDNAGVNGYGPFAEAAPGPPARVAAVDAPAPRYTAVEPGPGS